MTVFADIADFDEDTRIDMIGKTVMSGPKSSADKPVMAAFVVENDAKADRYIKKLQKKFPGIRVIDRFAGPVSEAITVRVGCAATMIGGLRHGRAIEARPPTRPAPLHHLAEAQRQIPHHPGG